jgi:hypothetical protein
MRLLIAAGLAGAAIASLAACNKAPQASSGATAPPSAVTATPSAGPLAAQDMPHRKAGLWRTTVALEGMAQTMPATETCVDAASEAKMSMLGQQMGRQHCQVPQISRSLDGSIRFDSSCDLGPAGRSVSSGTITGDFNTSYKMVIETTTTGGPSGPRNGANKMTVAATWVGPCAADQRGGDVIMGGRKFNLSDSKPR